MLFHEHKHEKIGHIFPNLSLSLSHLFSIVPLFVTLLPCKKGILILSNSGCHNKGDGVPTNTDPLICIPCHFLCDIPYYIP